MRLASYFLMGISALALGACATADTAPSDAPAAAVSSTQEAQEMAAVMSSAPQSIDLTARPDGGTTEAASNVAHTPGVPEGCPVVDVLPDTRSITYFEGDSPAPNAMTARASIKEIRGGCEYLDDAVVVDIDMIMDGVITDKARYEGRKDLEAFMTFPYFIAVMDPQGNMIDKKIMATAMRFPANSNDLAHAEKITQTIPLSDIGLGSHYTIATGFQLTRPQLEYNRGSVSDTKPAAKKEAAAKAAPKKPAPAKAEPKKDDVKKDEVKADAPKAEDGPAPVAAKSGDAKMSPIID